MRTKAIANEASLRLLRESFAERERQADLAALRECRRREADLANLRERRYREVAAAIAEFEADMDM